MDLSFLLNKSFWIYLAKFAVSFCLLYYGTLAVIGLSAPGGYYSAFIAHYLNYINWLRYSILHTSKLLVSLLGYQVYLKDKYTLVINNYAAVKMVYTCIGYGIMSFWAAFVIANSAPLKTKLMWILAGWLMLWCINVARISLLLIVLTKHWSNPIGFDNHTWFNVAVYVSLFLMIYCYHSLSKSEFKRRSLH